MLYYDLFYRNNGIRKAQQLLSPPLPALERLDLPRGSILHYVPSSTVETGPASDEFLFRNVVRPIQMAHITAVGSTLGHPRKLSISADTLIRKYHVQHRRFRQMRDLEQASNNDQTLVVYNYGFISHLWVYVRSYYSDYYRWMNTEAAVWNNIAELAVKSDRHQFVVCRLPQILPSPAQLMFGAHGTITQRFVDTFATPEALLLLQLWKWFGEDRASSLLASVPDKALERVNLVFMESGHWFVLNLGLINSWRQATEMELKANPEAPTKGLPPIQMQRRFLRLMMSLQHVRTEAAPEVDAAIAQDETKEPDAAAPAVQAQAAAAPAEQVQVVKQDVKIPQADAAGVVKSTVTVQTLEHPNDTSKTDSAEDVVKQQTAEIDRKIEEDLAVLDRINQQVEAKKAQLKDQELDVVETETLEQSVMNVCDRLADQGALTAAEYKRYQKLSASYRELPAPDGSATSLAKFIELPKEALQVSHAPVVPDNATIVDKSMLHSSLVDFDKRYVKDVLHKDVAGMVLNLQRHGMAVTNYQTETVHDVLGSYHDFTVRVVPVEGAASTLRFKLPLVEDDGTYMANGVKYRMRKQRGDLPIRKIAPDRVALTSYFGKTFVSRSSKKVNDYGQWLRQQVMVKGLSAEDNQITALQPANVFDNTFKAPKIYSALAQGFRAFAVTQPLPGSTAAAPLLWHLNFDHTQREKLFGAEVLKHYERKGALVAGVAEYKEKGLEREAYLVMDTHGTLYVGQDGKLSDFGSIEQFLGLEAEKAPVDFAELKVLGRAVPVGIVLGYELGLERLMKLLEVTPRRVPAGQRTNLDQSEYELVFADETLIFPRDNRRAAMVLAGFNEFHRSIRVYSVHEFDRPGVYLNVLEAQGPSARYLREVDLMYRLFVDPITRDLLIEMHEPTDFRGLLMRSCDMLLADDHPDELDSEWMRIKGYERFAGAVYSEMVRSIRAHSGRPGRGKLPIDLNPYAVWKAISQDPAINLVADINPIENLKQVEAVTYNGTGGRSSRSMTKHTRAYHPNDMGTISESTVDSSDVAINTFLSGNPQFTSVRGISRRYKQGETGNAALLSTSALVSVGSDRDDPKRVNFIGIQQKHTVACAGYHQLPVRTGYEQVIAHRTSDLFASTAKQDGQVVSLSAEGMIVKFSNGELKGFELGRRYGQAEGATIPHQVITELKAGQKFKTGEVLVYNPGFFERDMLNPNSVVWKAGMLARTVLLESTQTLEDSSAISARLSKLLTTKTTKVKNIVVSFNQSVRKLVREGQAVESEDILCIIEDAVTANSDLFDEESLDTLRVLSAQTPQAKAKGVVERVEVFYHGDKEDMSESLRALANASDRELGRRARAAGKPSYSGSVNDGFRIDGDPLQLDTACIRVYITADIAAGVGDKGVFCNQMKTVFGEVMESPPVTESGKQIDAIFGQKSIADRIVLSPEIIGTTTTLLDVIGKKAVAAYEGHK